MRRIAEIMAEYMEAKSILESEESSNSPMPNYDDLMDAKKNVCELANELDQTIIALVKGK